MAGGLPSELVAGLGGALGQLGPMLQQLKAQAAQQKQAWVSLATTVKSKNPAATPADVLALGKAQGLNPRFFPFGGAVSGAGQQPAASGGAMPGNGQQPAPGAPGVTMKTANGQPDSSPVAQALAAAGVINKPPAAPNPALSAGPGGPLGYIEGRLGINTPSGRAAAAANASQQGQAAWGALGSIAGGGEAAANPFDLRRAYATSVNQIGVESANAIYGPAFKAAGLPMPNMPVTPTQPTAAPGITVGQPSAPSAPAPSMGNSNVAMANNLNPPPGSGGWGATNEQTAERKEPAAAPETDTPDPMEIAKVSASIMQMYAKGATDLQTRPARQALYEMTGGKGQMTDGYVSGYAQAKALMSQQLAAKAKKQAADDKKAAADVVRANAAKESADKKGESRSAGPDKTAAPGKVVVEFRGHKGKATYSQITAAFNRYHSNDTVMDPSGKLVPKYSPQAKKRDADYMRANGVDPETGEQAAPAKVVPDAGEKLDPKKYPHAARLMKTQAGKKAVTDARKAGRSWHEIEVAASK